MFVQQEKTYTWVDNSTRKGSPGRDGFAIFLHGERVVLGRQLSLRRSLIQQGAPSCTTAFALGNLFLNYNPDVVTRVNN